MQSRLNRNIGGFILHQFREFWFYYLLALVCLYLTHYLQSELPFLAKEIGDLVGEGRLSQINRNHFVWLAVGILIFRTISRVSFFYPARVLEKLLRAELIERLESTSPLRYESESSGQVFQVMSADVQQVRALIGFALLQLGNVIIALVVLVPKLMTFNPKLLYSLLPIFIATMIFILIVRKYHVYHKQTQDFQGDVQNFIIESYNGKKTIKNFHAELSFKNLFSNYTNKELDSFFKASVGNSFAIPLIPLGVGCSLLLGAYIIYSNGLGVTNLILLTGFVFLFLEPLSYLSWIGIVFSRSYAAWKRIKSLVQKLDSPAEIETILDKEPSTIPFWKGKLNLELFLKSNWSVLVGETGVGKTVSLKNIAYQLRKSQKKISYVAQEPFLYNDTIKKNLFLGRTPNDNEIKLALELLNLFELNDLSLFGGLLDLEVGENGKRVSGGQAKRIALVRSLLSGADYILWDDPFSSVDVILERVILDKIKSLQSYKSTHFILTSHRLTTVRYCEQVIYLDKEVGVIENGSTKNLLNEGTKVYEYFSGQMA